jgi:penicillin-binding protein-related factor A (putative recombinase)
MIHPYKSGKKFEEELLKSYYYFRDTIDDTLFVKRYPDAWMFGVKGKKKKRHRALCDMQVMYNGLTYHIEAKSSQNPIYYDMKYIRPHQWESMLLIERSGNPALFQISRRPEGEKKYFISIGAGALREIRDKYKQVDWAYLKKYGVVCKPPKRKRSIYEVGKVLK